MTYLLIAVGAVTYVGFALLMCRILGTNQTHLDESHEEHATVIPMRGGRQ